ncbi:MAG: regulatory protein RecX [Gemmatimonadales bacterium]
MTATATDAGAGPRRVIGAVLPDARRPGSVRVMVDGRPLLTLAAEAAAAEGLAAGQVLDHERFERLSGAADAEAAFRTALRLLGRRPFAERDLSRRLLQKGHPAAAVAQAMDKAGSLGLVDDECFARHYVETRAARGRGPVRLRRDLLALGLAAALIDRTLAAVLQADDSAYPSVEALARKRLGQLKGLPPAVRRRRLVAYLARRGYGGDAVRTLVGKLLER